MGYSPGPRVIARVLISERRESREPKGRSIRKL